MRLPSELIASLRPAYEGTTVCVTGGCGFIGSHTVDALVALGARVAVIDDLSNSDPDHLLELIDLEPDRVRFIDGSVLDPAAMQEAVRGASVLLHLAAIGSVPRSIIEPRRVFAVNAGGTVAALEAARAAGARRFVLSSSSSVYGWTEGTQARSESEPLRPRSPYAASKVAAEASVQAWCRAYGLTSTSSPPPHAATGCRACAFGTSTSSARGRARRRATPPSSPRSSKTCSPGSPR